MLVKMEDFTDISTGFDPLCKEDVVDGEDKKEKEDVQDVQTDAVKAPSTQALDDAEHNDHKEFYEYLRVHLEAQMPPVSGDGSERDKVEIFGAKELHEDGNPHYHVLIRFEHRVHWVDTYSRLAVPFVEDGVKKLVSTSIRVGHPRKGQRQNFYMNSVCAYILKGTGLGTDWVFGHRIKELPGAGEARRHRENEVARRALKLKSRLETRLFLEQEEPAKCVWNRINMERLLLTKEPEARARYTVDYVQAPYYPTKTMMKWMQQNFAKDKPKGRPTCLVLIGNSRLGKTDWAMSIGNPIMMVNSMVFDEMTTHCSHIVLNDMDFRSFKEWREFMGCQMKVTITGKYREEKLLDWGKPAIFTATMDNNPLTIPRVADYFRQSGGVVEYLTERLF
ncbi:hypothetical protein BKA67DRAFT_568729 [Truncatella angustata]|uniref:Replication-associated protein n=1 Tax=Truncatella angustata TaxID=152316 RepID=A0A9P8UJ68_9PEZI|nr:uncharacterized protein BKA67DRAFT_568729 [Truncatella angustata]KAH6653156.1 hypothetical protein BKA67DRAFT_568729 [Truncatella angustata]